MSSALPVNADQNQLESAMGLKRRAVRLTVMSVTLLVGSISAGHQVRAASAANGAKDEKAAAEAAKSTTPSFHYVHQWIPVPAVAGVSLSSSAATSESSEGYQEQAQVAARKGHMTVIVFIASWCEPCQQLMPDLRRLQQRYQRLATDFIYVFAHDTKDDAEGFMREFNLPEAVLANYDVLKAYHNPELPTIYVGDRQGWLVARYSKLNPRQGSELQGELAKLDTLLRHLTAL